VTSAASPRKTYRSLDAFRGLASLFVVLYHTAAILTGRYPDLSALPLYKIAGFGYLGVPVFFVVSGYCIAASAMSARVRPNGSTTYFKQRLRRIYPTCWFSLLLFALASIGMNYLVHAGKIAASGLASRDLLHQSLWYYVANITLMQPLFHQSYLSIVCWTLSYEVAFYAILGICLILARRNIAKQRLVLDAAHVITIVCLLLLVCAPSLRHYPFDLWAQFGFGVLVYDLLTNDTEKTPRLWVIPIAALTAAFVALHSIKLGLLGEPSRLTYTIAAAFAALLWAMHKHDDNLLRTKVVSFFAQIGTFSYSLYLTHFLVLGVVMQVAARLGLKEPAHYLLTLLSIVCAVIAGRIFYQFCERPFITSNRPKPASPSGTLHTSPAPTAMERRETETPVA